MAAHPVAGAAGFERISPFAVGDDVHEQFAAGTQPLADARYQVLVVAHMFEHLDRYATVVRASGQRQHVHVAGDDLHMPPAAFAAACLDVLALGCGV
ncbi:hypothetical protein G6F24_016865 [Rhizopus arrhizus]|nr:hypothetical protein G6F24_016865 [Rhizopus arrhizus]